MWNKQIWWCCVADKSISPPDKQKVEKWPVGRMWCGVHTRWWGAWSPVCQWSVGSPLQARTAAARGTWQTGRPTRRMGHHAGGAGVAPGLQGLPVVSKEAWGGGCPQWATPPPGRSCRGPHLDRWQTQWCMLSKGLKGLDEVSWWMRVTDDSIKNKEVLYTSRNHFDLKVSLL